MATKNPITGDLIKSKYSDSYADKFDAIFRKPDPRKVEDQENEDEAFEKIEKHTQVKDSTQGG